MEKLFWKDPYQTTLQTTIVELQGNEILLAQTIAYSFSGGQESDQAWLNGIEIQQSRMIGTLIYYTLPEGHGLSCNQEVTLTINWERRYRLMRLHFAAELILEIVTQHYHFEKVGAHISESKARIDFLVDHNIAPLFQEILALYNAIIKQDYPIQTGFSNQEEQRRFWKIESFAEVPCGGTHVKSTGEVGLVSLKRSHPGKGVERVEIRLVQD